jgi:hypothetical protein
MSSNSTPRTAHHVQHNTTLSSSIFNGHQANPTKHPFRWAYVPSSISLVHFAALELSLLHRCIRRIKDALVGLDVFYPVGVPSFRPFRVGWKVPYVRLMHLPIICHTNLLLPPSHKLSNACRRRWVILLTPG